MLLVRGNNFGSCRQGWLYLEEIIGTMKKIKGKKKKKKKNERAEPSQASRYLDVIEVQSDQRL